jgi:hypothetical protein
MHNLREKMYDKEQEIRELLSEHADKKLEQFQQKRTAQTDEPADADTGTAEAPAEDAEEDVSEQESADGSAAADAAADEGSAEMPDETAEESGEPDEAEEPEPAAGDAEAAEPDEPDGLSGEEPDDGSSSKEDSGEAEESADEGPVTPEEFEEEPETGADEERGPITDVPDDASADDTGDQEASGEVAYDTVVQDDIATIKQRITDEQLDVKQVLEAEKRHQSRDELIDWLNSLIEPVEAEPGQEATGSGEEDADENPEEREKEIEDLKQSWISISRRCF